MCRMYFATLRLEDRYAHDFGTQTMHNVAFTWACKRRRISERYKTYMSEYVLLYVVMLPANLSWGYTFCFVTLYAYGLLGHVASTGDIWYLIQKKLLSLVDIEIFRQTAG